MKLRAFIDEPAYTDLHWVKPVNNSDPLHLTLPHSIALISEDILMFLDISCNAVDGIGTRSNMQDGNLSMF
jgi:hypothetical protein